MASFTGIECETEKYNKIPRNTTRLITSLKNSKSEAGASKVAVWMDFAYRYYSLCTYSFAGIYNPYIFNIE